MSKPAWTREQETAIYYRGENILVAAAAGAGKTAVLVERIIQRVLDSTQPVDVDKLLVVTFTNAAAQEMRERINSALTRRYQDNPTDKHLQRQLLLLSRASISTLHAFCLEIIRQNYYQLSLPGGLALDPRFRIADDTEAMLLQLEVLEELFEDKYTEEDEIFLELVEGFGGERDDKILQDLVLKLYEFSRSQPRPSLWLAHVEHSFQANLEDEITQSLFHNMLESIIIPLEDGLEKLKEAQRLALSPGGPALYNKNLTEEIHLLEDILAKGKVSWQAVYEAMQGFRFNSLKPCRAEVDEALKKQVQELRDEVKKSLQQLQQEYFNRSPVEMLQDMRDMAPLMGALCHLVEEFSFRFLKAKLQRNIIDFSDIEHFTLALLRKEEGGQWLPSPLAEKLRTRYEEVLIDEYQDINPVQEAILAFVSRQNGEKPNMFMVGDVKQSIYGFRMAEPGLFLAKYRAYGQEPGVRGKKIILAENFRSRQEIIRGVNFIFRQLMSPKVGGIIYDREAELVCGASYPPGTGPGTAAIEVHMLQKNRNQGEQVQREEKEENPGDYLESEELDTVELEARLIGRRILQLFSGESEGGPFLVWDRGKGEYRPVTYRDMVVLLRTTRGQAHTYLEVFRQLGIPAYAEVGTGYFAAQEVQTMVALLQVIDNPRQDIPLVATLRSPLVGLTAEELTSVRLQRPYGDFYDSLRLAARKESGRLGEELRAFLQKLQSWRTYARRNSLVDLIWLLYRETGYYDYAGAMPGGKQRQANLRALHDRAKEYESTTYRGLFKFLRFLEKLEETNNDLGAARALGENEDVVRIMSVHKSKGLEFPVVFLAGLGRKFNQQDLQQDILLDKELGLGPVWVDYRQRLKYPTLAKMAIKNKLKRDLLAEEIRLLYVAMTRAREKLILVGTLKDTEKKIKSWGKVIGREEWELPLGVLTQASCYWDWLGPCLIRHRSGEPLRAKGTGLGFPAPSLADYPVDFKISFWETPLQITQEENSGDYRTYLDKVRRLEPVPYSPVETTGIIHRLAWAYPHRALADIPAKLSVTEIKNRYQYLAQDHSASLAFVHWRELTRRPRFLQEKKGLSANEKGSAYHLVMRHLEVTQELSRENIEGQIRSLVEREVLTPAQGEAVDAGKIEQFFHSPLGQRMRKAEKLLREVTFTLVLPVAELYPEVEDYPEEKILVQGTIDCLWEESEGFVLMDYKTDLVTEETMENLRSRYHIQMMLYSRAAEQILKKPVREKILYSFALDQPLIL
ncbi:helicase-exonuclease AddAB subunit AddA [Thermanaerosceptrum fracticalcis]|nr:helicase-exonuclease AddAB subunit AddA [Thermanaerosceptrum fracticalcis]